MFWARIGFFSHLLNHRHSDSEVTEGGGHHQKQLTNTIMVMCYNQYSFIIIPVSLILVTARNLLGLNNFQSVLYIVGMPGSSARAFVSMAENTMLNSVGASTQPCFTSLVTAKSLDMSPLSNTGPHEIDVDLDGQPNLVLIFHRPSLLTVSKALVRSTKVQ